MQRREILKKARRIARSADLEVSQVLDSSFGSMICLVDRQNNKIIKRWQDKNKVLPEIKKAVELYAN